MLVLLAMLAGLCAATIAVGFLYRSERDKRRDAVVTLAITMLGTFYGVFLSTWATEAQSKRSESKSLIGLIQLLRDEAKDEEHSISYLHQKYESNFFNEPTLNGNPTLQMSIIRVLENNKDFSSNDPEIITYFTHSFDVLQFSLAVINNPKIPYDTRLISLSLYAAQLKYVQWLCDITIKYLQGDISRDTFNKHMDGLYQKAINDRGYTIRNK